MEWLSKPALRSESASPAGAAWREWSACVCGVLQRLGVGPWLPVNYEGDVGLCLTGQKVSENN